VRENGTAIHFLQPTGTHGSYAVVELRVWQMLMAPARDIANRPA